MGLFGCFLCLLLVQEYIYKTGGVPSRMPFSSNIWTTFSTTEIEKICGIPHGDQEVLFEKRWCIIGDKHKQPSFLLIGDSHAEAMMQLFHSLGKQNGKSGFYLYRSGCPSLIGVLPRRGKEGAEKCMTLNNEALKMAKEKAIKTVFMIDRWDYYLNSLEDTWQQQINTYYGDFSTNTSRKVFATQIIKTFFEYGKTNADIVVMLQVPFQDKNPMQIYRNVYSDTIGKKK